MRKTLGILMMIMAIAFLLTACGNESSDLAKKQEAAQPATSSDEASASMDTSISEVDSDEEDLSDADMQSLDSDLAGFEDI